MALIVAQASGNFSNPAIWFDGVVPTVDDFVHSNNFTIQVDTDINVGRISNDAAVPARVNPSMGNNTSGGAVASASSNGGSAWVAFDGSNSSTGNSWVATDGTGGTGWVAVQLSSTRRVVRYQLSISVDTNNLNQNPTAWEFQGSDDGITWITLNTVTGFVGGAGTIYDSGTFTQTTSYLRYRLNVTAAGAGATRIRVGELSLFELGNNRTSVVGGQYQVTTARSITLTAATPIGHGLNTPTILVNHPTGDTILNCSNAFFGRFSLGCISHINTGTFTINCSSVGGSNNNSGTTLSRAGTGTLNIVGNVIGPTSGASNTSFSNSGTGNINITGNVIAGNSNQSSNVISSSNGDIVVTGGVSGGTSVGTTGITITSGTLVVNGTVEGNTVPAITTTAVCTVNGNVLTNGAGAGVSSTGTGTTTVIGNANASATGNAIYITNAGHTLNFTGNIINTGLRQAICATTIRLSDSLPSFWQASTVTNAAKVFYTADTFPDSPAVGNVRQGTTYGPGSSLTGTLAVPSPSNVLSGVATDNTIGTYSTTPGQIATEIFTKLLSDSDFSTVGSFGKLVKDNLDATVSSRSTQTSVDAIPTNPLLTTDSRLNNLDASISSRLSSSSYVAPNNADISSIKGKTDNLPSDPADNSDILGAIASIPGSATPSQIADAVRTELTTELARIDVNTSSRLASASYVAPNNSEISAIKAKTDALPSDPADNSDILSAISSIPSAPTASTVASAVRTELTTELNRIDANVSSRLASASYVAPDNASVTLIKAKTDNLPMDPASEASLDEIKKNTDLIPATI